MEWFYQFVSCLLPLGLLIACLYLVRQVRKATEQFQKFEKLFRALREANTKTRFGITGLKHKMNFLEVLFSDLQEQVNILLHPSGTEVKNGDNNPNSSDSSSSVRNP